MRSTNGLTGARTEMHTKIANALPTSPGSRLGLIGAACIALASHATPAAAGDAPDPLNDPWTISLGMYLVEASTDVTLDGTAGEQGTKVDWNKAFGGGSQSRIRLDAQWRFAERHKLQAMLFSSSHSNSRTLDEEVDWGGETYPIGAKVKGSLDYDIYLLDYEYAFMRRDTYEVSASIGAYYANWQASLDATLEDPDSSEEFRQRGDASLDVPLPVLGLRGQWALPHNLSLDVSGQWFYLSIDQYSGNLQDYRATLTWQPKKWLGVGVGYDWFGAHGDVDQSNFHGELDWTFNGPMLFYNASF